jgi:hypothetical protein
LTEAVKQIQAAGGSLVYLGEYTGVATVEMTPAAAESLAFLPHVTIEIDKPVTILRL